MADTHGFEVIAEITLDAMKQLLKAAWKSGGDDSAQGVIPEYINIPGPTVPAPVSFGPYQVSSAHVQIPQEQLDLEMDTGINGVKIKIGTINHVEIANPPIDSAKLFDIDADVFVRTPIRVVGPNNEVGADFTAMPADAVSVVITSGDPIAPVTNAAIEEFVHKKYQEGAIPHVIDPIPLSLPPFNMKTRVEFYDDATNAAKKITVSKPDPTHVKLNIPTYIRFYDITGSVGSFQLATPMGVNAVTEMLADYIETADHILVKTAAAVVTLTNIAPAAGIEGVNYGTNKTALGIAGYNLDTLLASGFQSGAATQLHSFGNVDVTVPTVTQIEAFIADKVKAELLHRQSIQVWKVVDPSGTTPVNDVAPKALSDVLAICINAGAGANVNAVTNFVPSNRNFAIATSAQKVKQVFNQQAAPQIGREQQVEGKTARINSLNLDLLTGLLSVNGEVTVVDAILDSIDVDADFDQKVSLSWKDNADGTQKLEHKLEGDPDIDLGAAAWILTALLGFLTLGVIGLVIGLVIVAVVESIASQIGGVVARDESGKVTGIGAWPQNLDNIGNVKARFENPVIIEPSGLVFAGTMLISSKNALTSIDAARSHGPYTTSGNVPVNLNGGADKPTSVPLWLTGDGNTLSVRSASHRYGKSGLYIARVQIRVDETGGATTKHYTTVRVNNVAPKVSFTQSSLVVNEGEEVALKVTFTDENWLDTHKATFDFGDNTKPQEATVTESNKEPQAQGEATIKHAWCDNGDYTVRVSVQDSAGGIGEATLTVTVLNVPPKIITCKKLCVLIGQPVRLEAAFTDPGWCDTHVATWDCGDGTLKMATITEKHLSPQGIGLASITHVYHCIGNYIAKVTVTDDDGGEAAAFLLISVVSLMNAYFENGFRVKAGKEKRVLQEGIVANEWQPFAEPFVSIDPALQHTPPFKAVHFIPHEFICRDGQRAQGVRLEGSGTAGIRQTVCSNCGWEYEFTVMYHLPLAGTGIARIGIDPTGGTTASSQDVVWVESLPVDDWVHLSVRVKAKRNRISCFIGVQQSGGQSELYIDHAVLYMLQPCDPLPLLMHPERKQEACCDTDELDKHDFKELDKYMSGQLTMVYPSKGTYSVTAQGIRFTDRENEPVPFRLSPQMGRNVATMLIKGGIQLTTQIAKQALSSTLGRFVPFLREDRS